MRICDRVAALMSRYDFQIPITFKHRILFDREVFSSGHPVVAELLAEGAGRRVVVFMEKAIAAAWPNLGDSIAVYFAASNFDFRGVTILQGGEPAKADDTLVKAIWEILDAEHIDRHSYVLAIGGGAFMDAVGYAAATAHRGVRLVRFPTTTLSQCDSGVGVKCGINGFGKKNWIGSFAVPFAVVNDFSFLESLDFNERRLGLIEAVKVALVRDAAFYGWLELHADHLARLEPAEIEECVEKSALLHAGHIAHGGDPFEAGSSRPLDFGHWAAHKLEAMTSYQLGHSAAVAVGLALDTLYSARAGHLEFGTAERILELLGKLELDLYHPALDWLDELDQRRVYAGIDEFREHLGGELTILLLAGIGKGVEVHNLDLNLLSQCINELRTRWESRG